MAVEISYMGTKRRLAAAVAEIVQPLPDGPMLDAFSGMCAVCKSIAPTRQIWANDVHVFPALVAKALFCSRNGPISSDEIRSVLERQFQRNLVALESRFKSYLRREQKYIETRAVEDVITGNTKLPYVGNNRELDHEREYLARKPSSFPYRLATITYVGSFFGAKQSMEIDSLRYAIDLAAKKEHIDQEQRHWLLIALGQVLCRINNSTGQFAQYIKPNEKNIHRIIEKRCRSVWDEFLTTVNSISPLGTQKWRSRNRTFCSDAISLLGRMRKYKYRPAIVYADPPYSDAQYSRYYHVLDMLVEYRYPPVTGVGRYPDKRFQTPFAHATAVVNSVTKLVEGASNLQTSLVLSYPANGLFCQKGGNILELLRRHYKRVSVAYSAQQEHSTFGGPRAAPKVSALENVYIASF